MQSNEFIIVMYMTNVWHVKYSHYSQIMSQYFSWVKNFALKNETASLINVIGRI